jgi:hypothetical protein
MGAQIHFCSALRVASNPIAPAICTAAAFLVHRLQSVRREVKSTLSVVLKTVSLHPLGETRLLSPSPFRQRFLFLPKSPGRRVPQSPSPRCDQEPGPCLAILAHGPRRHIYLLQYSDGRRDRTVANKKCTRFLVFCSGLLRFRFEIRLIGCLCDT